MNPQISIIIPQYKTFEVTRLCLRALKKFSSLNIEVIVVDNNSSDDSLEYLKKNKWIKLIENHHAIIGGQGHKQALDIGIKAATGDWVLLFHSDSIVLKHGWDIKLLNLMKQYPEAVGASSIVREMNTFTSFAKKILRLFKEKKYAYKYTLSPTNNKIMSYCFLLNRQFLLSTDFNFEQAQGDVADALYQTKIKKNKPFILMGRGFLEPLIWHTSNVSSILTGQIKDSKSVVKFHKKLSKLFSSPVIKELINDQTLDNF